MTSRCLAWCDRPVTARYRVDGDTARKRGAVHEPDCVLAGRAVTPQNVRLAVSVKVSDSRDAPVEVPHGREEPAARHGGAVHEPDRVLAGRAVAPQDVGLAISVKVSDSRDASVEISLVVEA